MRSIHGIGDQRASGHKYWRFAIFPTAKGKHGVLDGLPTVRWHDRVKP